jgi:ubiquinol-cytochrome c reductase cytochrome b subunit
VAGRQVRRGARVRTYLLRKVYPDHWSFLLGEIALYSFIICC